MGDIGGTSRTLSTSRPYRDLMASAAEARTPNYDLIELRDAAGLSQQDLADELNRLAGEKYNPPPQRHQEDGRPLGARRGRVAATVLPTPTRGTLRLRS